jgi:hypothetical protein
MVQGISSPGAPAFQTPVKPVQQNQPVNAPGAAPIAPPAQAPGGGRPVRAAVSADADKHLVDERATSAATQHADSTHLSIGRDDAAGRYVYRGIDGATQEVQKQWPSEEQLKRIAMLRELTGRIVDEKL